MVLDYSTTVLSVRLMNFMNAFADVTLQVKCMFKCNKPCNYRQCNVTKYRAYFKFSLSDSFDTTKFNSILRNLIRIGL